ncbi:putative alpha-actinin [Histomonas meleagridis]|uniref:putative alpha-actinin n=1 Tax=Histomonas meleagridis TaxID=135588 RepID=UPI0035599877|nr:putative alpha-actinin [Histomonas meleagridis]KAH0799476.1 putative alpha-actinin [Histomonas meleagridis]
MYACVLAQATNSLNEIYNTMVQSYDAKAAEFIERIKPIETSAKELEEIEQLDAPFEELTQYKLNYKAKASPTDVLASADALVATINHLIQHNEGEIIETRNSSKISEYNEKANVILETAKALEASLDGFPESNEEKLTALFEKQKEVEAEKGKVEEILPLYEEIEKDSLETEVENSPSAISQFFANTLRHRSKKQTKQLQLLRVSKSLKNNLTNSVKHSTTSTRTRARRSSHTNLTRALHHSVRLLLKMNARKSSRSTPANKRNSTSITTSSTCSTDSLRQNQQTQLRRYSELSHTIAQ